MSDQHLPAKKSPTTAPLEPYRPSQKDVYEWIAKQIEREDGLVNVRVTWTLSFHGFLFAALAVTADENSDKIIKVSLQVALPVVGAITAALAHVAVRAAMRQIAWLRAQYTKVFVNTGCDNQFIRPCGVGETHRSGNSLGQLLPLVLMVVWILIGIVYLVSSISVGGFKIP